MKQVGVYEAKTRLSSLVDEVEKGETIEITRHGRPAARLVPITPDRRRSPAEVIESMRQIREEIARAHPGVRYTAEEIKNLINEGRR